MINILSVVHYILQSYFFFTDKCPSYNSYQGNMDENDCSTDHNGTCPSAPYISPLSVICKHQRVLQILFNCLKGI